VVGKGAGFKFLPQIEVTEFDFRAEPDIAGEQADNRRFGKGAQGGEEFPDAGARFGFAVVQNVIEPEHVTFEKAGEVLLRWFDVVIREKLADEICVRAAGEFQFFKMVVGVELGLEDLGKRLDSSAARVNERAVDIE